MSKTYSVQIEKAQSLLKGVSLNFDKAASYGITHEQLRKLEQIAVETDKINRELDAMRIAVSEKAAQGNKCLLDLRKQIQEIKQIVKRNMEQTCWASMGIADKR